MPGLGDVEVAMFRPGAGNRMDRGENRHYRGEQDQRAVASHGEEPYHHRRMLRTSLAAAITLGVALLGAIAIARSSRRRRAPTSSSSRPTISATAT